MARKFALILLILQLSFSFSMIAMAGDSVPDETTADEAATTEATDGSTGAEEQAASNTDYKYLTKNCQSDFHWDANIEYEELENLNSTWEDSISSGTCGEPDSNGYFWKSNCTDQRLYITELSESIGPSGVSVDDNKVVDVYKGVCCQVSSEADSNGGSTCSEALNIYTDTFQQCNDNAAECDKRQWIIGSSGAGIIKIYIKLMYSWAAGIVGFIAVITIVFNGIRISVSGVSGDISSAKDQIIKAISAIALLFLSGIILYTINPTFFS